MILFFSGIAGSVLCAAALFLWFYLTRYEFSPKRAERFDALCAKLYARKRARAVYAALGGLLLCGVFCGVCLLYSGFYTMLTGYPLVLLPLSRAMMVLLLALIALLGAVLIAHWVIPLHVKLYLKKNRLS